MLSVKIREFHAQTRLLPRRNSPRPSASHRPPWPPTSAVVAAYERGAKKPEMDRMPAIAEALGVGVEELYGKAAKRPLPAKTHKNKRTVKVQELFEKLPQNEQRVLLKQIKLMAQQKR